MSCCRDDKPDADVWMTASKYAEIARDVALLAEAKELLLKARRILLNLVDADTESEYWGVSADAKSLLRERLTPFLTPEPTTPRFAVGDPVWSFNGQPRVVTAMRWAQAMRRSDQPKDYEPPWCWFLDTVDPDDPTCKGCGDEDTYRPRVEGVIEPSLAEAYWAAWKARETA